MILIFPDTGLVTMLQKIVTPKVTFNLFINDVHPTADTLLSNLQRANWSGYAPIDVPASAWAFTNVTAHVGEISATDIFWVNTSPAVVQSFGYYIVDDTGTVLLAAARFDNAPYVTVPLHSFRVSPLLGSFSGLDFS
jgi:hypothetical protein